MAFSDTQTSADIDYGESPAVIELVGVAIKGDALGYSGGWKRALATVGSIVQMRCVAGEDGAVGQKITAYFDKCYVDGRFSGATAGGALYVAEGTSNGMYTQTIPATSGDATKVVGYMITATLAAIVPNANVDSVAP